MSSGLAKSSQNRCHCYFNALKYYDNYMAKLLEWTILDNLFSRTLFTSIFWFPHCWRFFCATLLILSIYSALVTSCSLDIKSHETQLGARGAVSPQVQSKGKVPRSEGLFHCNFTRIALRQSGSDPIPTESGS